MGFSPQTAVTRDLVAEIDTLRRERGAAILAHNYQRP